MSRFPKSSGCSAQFILACGTGHLLEAIIFWHPVYRLSGLVKAFTAIVSWGTVIALVPRDASAKLPGLASLNAQLTRKAGEAQRRANNAPRR